MFNLIKSILQRSRKSLGGQDHLTVYLPITPRVIPRNRINGVIKSWLHPELGTATVYLDLQQAIASQQAWQSRGRYLHTAALQVVVELQVPSELVVGSASAPQLNLYKVEFSQIENILVTAEYAAGPPHEDLLPGDKPYNGQIYEIIKIKPAG